MLKLNRRFVIFDRDGTLIVERNYLSDPEQVELIPGAASVIRDLHALGLGILVATNQSGIGRGYFSLEALQSVHQKLNQLLAEQGAQLDRIYFCPHAPADGCSCRKPEIGLMEQAVSDFNFDPKLSFVVGDKACDIEFGRKAGSTTILVLTGYGKKTYKEMSIRPDYVVEDIQKIPNLIKSLLNPVGKTRR
jgi:D-glycero-D-manno-heptose 1,7-bisphosphate phosphatase